MSGGRSRGRSRAGRGGIEQAYSIKVTEGIGTLISGQPSHQHLLCVFHIAARKESSLVFLSARPNRRYVPVPCITALYLCSLSLLSITALYHCSPSLLSHYHCSLSLLCITALHHCSLSLLNITALLSLFCTALCHCCLSLLCITALYRCASAFVLDCMCISYCMCEYSTVSRVQCSEYSACRTVSIVQQVHRSHSFHTDAHGHENHVPGCCAYTRRQ
jgi:hypothetical protein